MKKGVIVLVFALVVASGVFAQEEKSASSLSNWISGELSFLGVGARYEHMLNDNYSIGANAYWSSFFFLWNELGVDVTARYYPWGQGKNFFVGVGLGFHIHTGTYEYEYDNYLGGKSTASWFGAVTGVAITPEVGWKIDVGEVGGFYLQPGIKIPITFGLLEPYTFTGGSTESEFRAGFGFVPYFGMGYAF